jgi:hypothetical protein
MYQSGQIQFESCHWCVVGLDGGVISLHAQAMVGCAKREASSGAFNIFRVAIRYEVQLNVALRNRHGKP